MFCQKFLTLLTLSLSVAPAVLAVPSWSIDYFENPLKNNSPQKPTHNNGDSSGGSKSNHPSTGSHHGHHSTDHGPKPAKVKVNGRGNICGSIVSQKQASHAEKNLKAARVAPSNGRAGPVNFDVYWHVIQENETKEGGFVSKEEIDAQLKVLDTSFDIANFDFTLKNVTYTTNAEWFNAAWFKDPDLEFTIKSSLRQGDAAAINVYTTNPGDGLLGYAYFPFMYQDAPEVDGVVIHWGSLPGGHLEQYDGGMTLVHELGHWLGLYHTFQGESCKGPGDYVSDTPQQAVQSNSCTPSDSCTDLPGGDPYTNFMDYSPDECLSEFTTGQIRRMRDEIRTYRGVANA